MTADPQQPSTKPRQDRAAELGPPGREAGSGLGSPEDAIFVRRGCKSPESAKSLPRVDELRRLAKLESRREGWRERATAMQAAGDVARARYARSRAEALGRRLRPRLESCGTQAIPLACKCEGRVTYERCRQWWLCRECQTKRTAAVEIRLRKSLEARLADESREWERHRRGMKPSLALVTLTARHTGDVELDRRNLEAGWRGLYRAMHPRWGRFAYVRVWEVTPGRCSTCEGYVDDLGQHHTEVAGYLVSPKRSKLEPVGADDDFKARRRCTCESPRPEGHVHMHIACIWGYRDYAELRRLWRKACPSSELISIVRARDDGQASTPRSCSKYLGKYLSKGVDVDAFTPELRADVSAGFYNAHSLDASKGFWEPEVCECPRCRELVKRIAFVDSEVAQRITDALGSLPYWVVRKRTLYDDDPRREIHRLLGWHPAFGLPAPMVVPSMSPLENVRRWLAAERAHAHENVAPLAASNLPT